MSNDFGNPNLNEANNEAGFNEANSGVAPPRFTLRVQMDNGPESDRLAQAVRRAAHGGSGPDAIVLLRREHENASEAENKDMAALRCRGALLALPNVVGCVIGETLVTLPIQGELARLHEQIAQAQTAQVQSVVNSAPENALKPLPSAGENGVVNVTVGGAVAQSSREDVANEALLELRSRVARLEGALVGQLMARLDDRLSRMATRAEVEEVAENVTETLQAVSAMATLLEQHQQDERHQHEKQEAWQETMIEEMRAYRRQVETLARDNEILKAQLQQRRWWRVWKT